MFRLQYSTERICADIGDILTIQHALHCKFDAECSARPLVCALWTVVPTIHNVITSPHIQGSIFKRMYLRYYWRHLDNSMRAILHTWCQIQHTSFRLRYVKCVLGHIQCIYSSAHSGFNIQLNVSALLLEIFPHFDARYAANLMSNIAHILQFTLCELWSRPYTM
jgi:hypothetical protein